MITILIKIYRVVFSLRLKVNQITRTNTVATTPSSSRRNQHVFLILIFTFLSPSSNPLVDIIVYGVKEKNNNKFGPLSNIQQDQQQKERS